MFQFKVAVKRLFCSCQASIPRPVARISITVVALAISLFVLKSFVSTAFFALVCFIFYINSPPARIEE